MNKGAATIDIVQMRALNTCIQISGSRLISIVLKQTTTSIHREDLSNPGLNCNTEKNTFEMNCNLNVKLIFHPSKRNKT